MPDTLKMYGKVDKKYYYDYYPKVVRSHSKVSITVKSRFDGIALNGDYGIVITPFYEYDCNPYESQDKDVIFAKSQDGVLVFEYQFGSEQAYDMKKALLVENEHYLLFTGMMYALDDDLFELTPLRGDLHCHTIYSDGYESPEMVITAAQRHGFDFIAITDHNNFEGSMQGKKSHVPGITIISGEEFACDYTPMHIISLGARSAVDSQFLNINFVNSYEVQKIRDDEKDKIDTNLISYACTQALIDEIHNCGGLAVLCHAFWKPLHVGDRRMDVPESLLIYLLKNCKFDAFEVVSGSPVDDSYATDMQESILQYVGLTASDIAFLGVTDSHMYSTDPLSGNHYTIVFAYDTSEDAIIKAIKKKQTVAVEIIGGKTVKCHGDYRLIKYAYFLIKYYWKFNFVE